VPRRGFFKAVSRWTTCFTIYNLTLPASPYLGFSAHTGDVSGQYPRCVRTTGSSHPADDHDILQVSAANVVYHPPAPGQKRRTSKGTIGFGFFSFLFFILKWLAVLVVVVLAALAFRTWNGQRQAKRF
jgi:mannose-binding lectin 2